MKKIGICGENKQKEVDTSTHNSQSFNGTHNLTESLSNISNGINSLNTRPETKIDNRRFTEYDEIMKIMINNLTKNMPKNKKIIGKGGQATIRKYYSQKFKKYVVEKVINIDSNIRSTLGEKGIWNNFNLLKEAIILSGFDHPNVVKIYDYKKDPPTIIMEYCAKGSLRSILVKHFVLLLFIKYI